jgi:hypothetical protein
MQSLPQLSVVNKKMVQWLVKAGFKTRSEKEMSKLFYFCSCNAPVTKPMLPKLLSLLHSFHHSDQKVSTWYFQLQETIKNHYRTKGSCLFFEDSVKILSGEKDFDGDDALKKGAESLKNCVQVPGPFGTTQFL